MSRTGTGRRPHCGAGTLAAAVTALAVLGLAPGSATADPSPAPVDASGTEVVVVHTTDGVAALRSSLTRFDAGAAVRHDLGGNAVSVRIPAIGAASQLARLSTLPGVTGVEPPVVRTLTAVPSTATTYLPDDPYLSQQRTYLDAIGAPAAWAGARGSAAVTIAIVDSGVDVTNPDLQGKVVGTYDATKAKSGPVTDDVGHGTFVAGVAAAGTDNGIGIAGIGFNTRLLAVKVADKSDNIAIDDEVRGIRWAVDHGANIINLSLGGSEYSSSEAAAVAYAQAHGVLVVAAAGNDGGDTIQYPAGYPGVITVGATDPAHQARADFSDHGSWVTVAASGVHILSTVPLKGSLFFPKATYAIADGTSFSTPIVAGEAALLKAQNPSLSVAALRAAIVGSAHGYSGLGLGAGSVDLGLALAHIAPTSTPTALFPTTDRDDVQVTAQSDAPAVAFRLDSAPYGKPVPVSNGSATTTIPTYGFANGRHTLSAVDCTIHGECATQARSATFDLASDPATLDSPQPGGTVTGLVHVTASRPGGGGLRLLVDGRPAGFRSGAPYTFALSASGLTDGPHTFAVQTCSVDGTLCAGPTSPSASVTSDALHPTLAAADPGRISPNGDHVRDTATLRFTLPSSEQTDVLVLGADGHTLARTALGTLAAGAHTWTWRGLGSTGVRLHDGTYTLALSTSAGGREGWVQTTGVVDTSAPQLRTGTGGLTTIYPYPDGYRDGLRSVTAVSENGVLTMTVTNSYGRVVRRIALTHRPGAAAISWNGTDSRGHRVTPGRYRFRLAITDAAGNTRTGPPETVWVSGQRLVRTTVSVVAHAAGADSSTGSAPCAHVHAKGSQYRGGALFANSCVAADYDVALAQYVLTVPRAIRYTAIAIGVYGRSTSTRSQLTASIQRTDGILEVPGYLNIRAGRPAWHTIATVPAAGHIDAKRRVDVTVVLTAAYPEANAFDAQWVRLRVGLVVLR